MSEKNRILCLNILLTIYSLIGNIESTCTIRFPSDVMLRPKIFKNVGSHKIRINNFDPNNIYYLLFEGQQIEAHCDIEFNSHLSHNKLYIKCDGYVYTKTDVYSSYEYDRYSSEIFLECSKLKWKMYESLNNFPWCSANVTSYILGRPKHSNSREYDYLAGICFDIYNISFKSVYYTLAPGSTEFVEPQILKDVYLPSFEINYIKETFGENSLTLDDFSKNLQFRNWMKISNYKFTSMVQHSKVYTSFNDQFKSLLDFISWQNLRLYNWNNYQMALEAHVERDNQIYDILAGISGALKVPFLEDCQRNYSMKELYDDKNRQIPMYVWNYLQARNDSTKDIVIIGFNSPFYEFFSENDIVFCQDKCQEISWLKQFSFNFRRSTMGIVFCCNVDDVKISKRLSGFPEGDMTTKPQKIENKTTVESIFKNEEEATTTMVVDDEEIEIDLFHQNEDYHSNY